jgi:integrase
VYAEQFRLLLRNGASVARVSDLHDLLAAYRLRCLNRERPTYRSFNLCRAAVLSYLRFAFRDQRPLWREIGEQIRPFPPERRRRAPRHLTASEVTAYLPKFSLKYRGLVWSLFTTGMRISEYLEEGTSRWTVLPDRIHVSGAKTPAADRDIPRIDCPVKHRIHPRSCAQVLARVTNQQCEPRDLRRSYARLLADAGIPEYRQAAYMGHAARTMTLHYQVGGIEHFLHEDAARIRDLIARTS